MAAIDAFTEKLNALTDLSIEDLEALETEVMAAFDTADQANNEVDMNDLATALDQIRSEIDHRSSAPVDGAPTPTTASAEIPEEDSMPAVQVPADRAPKVEEAESPTTIIAAADIPGIAAGTEFTSEASFNEAMASRINTLTRVRGGDGERSLVASIVSKASEDRTLRQHDPEGNREKIEAVTGPSAIVAAGGCCAPLTTRYDLFSIGETARPVRDSLAGFNADRGGIRYFASPTLDTLSGNVGFWTCDDDEAYDEADPETWKVCGRVDCPAESTAITQAVTSCLTFGVLSSRVFPENVSANTKLALVQHARVAESALLAKIKAGSTAIAGPAVQYGAVRDILLTIARVGAWYRDRNRLGPDTPLRAHIPMFVLDILRSDIIVQPPAGDGRTADFAISANDVENFFDQWGINVTWTLDGASPTVNGGGIYGPLSGGALPAFPTSVEWSLFAEGAWLFLDGGTLDLGVVRDSKLVRSNDYMQFSETFESAAKVGGTSLWVTSPLTVRGGYSPAISLA